MGRAVSILKIFILILSGIIMPNVAFSQTWFVRINSVSDTVLCIGDTFKVNYQVVNRPFDSSNVFRVQLSDSAGSFTGALTIGSLAAYVAGIGQIDCIIPTTIPPGVNYKVRIFADAPAFLSAAAIPTLQVNHMPSSGIWANVPICSGDSLILRDTGTAIGVTYYWQIPWGSFLSRDTVVHNVPTSYTGMYQLNTTLGGCEKTSFLYIPVDSAPLKPIISVNAPPNASPFCTGDSIRFSIEQTTPNSTYTWSGPGGYTAFGAAPFIVDAGLANSGSYRVTVIKFNNCAARDTAEVVVNQSPKKPIASIVTNPVCTGRSLALRVDSVTPGATYYWQTPKGQNFNQKDLIFTEITMADAGLYRVSAMLPNCGDTYTVNVVVNTTPQVSSFTYTGRCSGDILSLVANTGDAGTFTWFNNNGFSQTSSTNSFSRPNATVDFSGRYYVTLQAASQCISDIDSVDVAITLKPEVPTVTTNSPVCEGQDLTLVGNTITPNVEYEWTDPLGARHKVKDITLSRVNSRMAGEYSLLVKLGECTSAAKSNVVINPFNTPAVEISANPGGEVNKFTEITFTADAIKAGDNPTYQWLKNDADIPGANKDTYVAVAGQDVMDNDKIAVRIGSMAECPLPASIISYVFRVRIKKEHEHGNFANDLHVYPNPSNGKFKIKGVINTNSDIELQVINATGTVIYTSTEIPVNKTLDCSIDLGPIASGFYLLRLKTDKQLVNLKFSIGN